MMQQTEKSHFNSGFVYQKLLLWEMKQVALIAGIKETNNVRSLLSQLKDKNFIPRLPA